MDEVVVCGTCGLIQNMAASPAETMARCARCRFALHPRKTDSRRRTLALAIAALILYFPANLFPITKTQYVGTVTKTTIFDGIQGLFQKGNYFVGALVFTNSILAPGIQLVGLVLVCLGLRLPTSLKFRGFVCKLIRVCDPWNMLPVTLLALVVAIVELGQVAKVHPGPGLFAFAGMVGLTVLASLAFDPEILWDRSGGTTRPRSRLRTGMSLRKPSE